MTNTPPEAHLNTFRSFFPLAFRSWVLGFSMSPALSAAKTSCSRNGSVI